ncbi:MAG TPA: thymidine phosphorylase, partial [Opitutaceae bacterium]|nr:thymidine phosphorylase [Opitutaceae bacterium]
AAQGGDPAVIDDPARLPSARLRQPVPSPAAGIVQRVDARAVALAALRLGAGRARAEDRIDPAVGIDRLVKIGERVAAGAPLATIHANDPAALAEAGRMLERAIVVGGQPAAPPPLILETIG